MMQPSSHLDTQEIVRRFNEEEAVWRSFEEKRLLRRIFTSALEQEEEFLDNQDWFEAERESRPTRAIGNWIAP